jgi:hypothetical protein
MYSSSKKEKVGIPILCAFGISAVAYGMVKENNLVFLVGLVFVIAGYLLIRGKLKASLRGKDSGGGNNKKKPPSQGP